MDSPSAVKPGDDGIMSMCQGDPAGEEAKRSSALKTFSSFVPNHFRKKADKESLELSLFMATQLFCMSTKLRKAPNKLINGTFVFAGML